MDLDDMAEAIAAEASDESGLNDRPIADPLILAVSYLELQLVPQRRRGARLAENRVYYPMSSTPRDAAYFVAHECGHVLVRLAKLRVTREEEEKLASRIGCALILPRRAFLRDVRNGVRVTRDLVELWPLATPRIVRRRLVELDALLEA